MTKVSETRSAVRRAVLVKAAGAYRGGITGTGVRLSTNDALKRQGSGSPTADTPAKKAYPPLVPPKYDGQGGWARMRDDVMADGIATAKRRIGTAIGWLRQRMQTPARVSPVVGGTAIKPPVR